MEKKILIEEFESINSFWNFLTQNEKWFIQYSPYQIEDIDKYINDLAPLLIQETNNLRFKMEFTYDEYCEIIEWDNIFIREDRFNESSFNLSNLNIDFKQYCSNCRKEIGLMRRYPKRICSECTEKITSIDGRKVEFFNTELMGTGCQGYYSFTNQKENYDSVSCYINNREFCAEEGRFGGIIIQLKG
jgi:hypothetical protein